MRRPVVATISGLSVALVGAVSLTAAGSQAAPSPQSHSAAVSAAEAATQPLAKKTKKTKTKKTKSTKTKTTKTKTSKTKTTKTTKSTSPTTTTTKTTTTTTPPAPSGTFTGTTVDTIYGPVQVQITVVSGKITASKALKSPNSNSESIKINQNALPKLEAQVLAAQSAKIDGVSGATFTSTGYKTSLQSAIDAIHA